MEYYGKLYGKIGNKYFDTGKDTDDFDEMVKLLKKIRDEKVSENYFEIEQLLTKITE